jgi:predicted Rossmann fold nucleotide-binding protein DprA/Smf involved in DNA uptake
VESEADIKRKERDRLRKQRYRLKQAGDNPNARRYKPRRPNPHHAVEEHEEVLAINIIAKLTEEFTQKLDAKLEEFSKWLEENDATLEVEEDEDEGSAFVRDRSPSPPTHDDVNPYLHPALRVVQRKLTQLQLERDIVAKQQHRDEEDEEEE